MKPLLLSFAFLFIFSILNAQTDSLSQYSIAELDSIYKTKKKPQEQLPYALAMLQKGENELNIKDTSYAKLLFNAGSAYVNFRDLKNATTYLQQSVDIWEVKMPMHATHAHCLYGLGLVYYYQGKYKETEKYWLQTLNIRKEVLGERHPQYAGILFNLGIVYNELVDYAQSEKFYLLALDTYKEIYGEKNLSYADCAKNLGNLYDNMGDYAESKKIQLKALSIYKEILGEKDASYGASLNNVGILYYKTGDYANAEKYWLQASQIQKETSGERNPSYAGGLANLGNLYYEMGDYDKVEKYWLQAMNIFKEVLGEKDLKYATILGNLGNLYKKVEDKDKAEKFYFQALEIKKEVLGEKHPNYATNLGNIGGFYSDMGDNIKAEKFQLQALALKKEVMGEKHPEYTQSLYNLGALYKNMKDYEKSEKFYLQALNTFKEVLGEKHPYSVASLEKLGKLFLTTASYSRADSFYTLAYNVKNNNLSTNFAWLPEKGKVAYWQQEKGFYESLNNYAAQAATELPQATVLAYQSNLIAKGLLLESSKEIEDAVNVSKDSITLWVYKELKDKKQIINHLTSSGAGKKDKLARYEAEADSLDKILVTRLGEYATAKLKFQITWKDVQAKLTENEVAIEFARFHHEKDSQYYYMALLLRKGYEYPKLVKLGAEKSISAIPAGKGFAELYKLIWEPIDTFLNGVETVYYSPDGVLNNIAFAALCSKGTEKVVNTKEIKRGSVGKTGGTETENCTYLSERYTLHQVSITRYLAEGLKTTQINNSMLVFGGVNYDEIPATEDTIAEVQVMDFDDYALAENISRSSTSQSRMEYLPGTQTELQNVQKIMQKKQWKIRAFSDKNASENTLKSEIQKESPSVLHIATHGFAFPDIVENKNDNKTYRDSDNPMARCGLLLAGANHSWTGDSKKVLSQTGEDGILTALEVSNLSLKNTKLVVLSACETGLGKIQSTEGVFGLKRGFKLALVEQIIVSLWSVPDKETMELMDIFYNDLAKTRNAVISFEKAQKEMRKKYATRPDLWAGFVLVR